MTPEDEKIGAGIAAFFAGMIAAAAAHAQRAEEERLREIARARVSHLLNETESAWSRALRQVMVHLMWRHQLDAEVFVVDRMTQFEVGLAVGKRVLASAKIGWNELHALEMRSDGGSVLGELDAMCQRAAREAETPQPGEIMLDGDAP